MALESWREVELVLQEPPQPRWSVRPFATGSALLMMFCAPFDAWLTRGRHGALHEFHPGQRRRGSDQVRRVDFSGEGSDLARNRQ
jgi:hypothetical protein